MTEVFCCGTWEVILSLHKRVKTRHIHGAKPLLMVNWLYFSTSQHIKRFHMKRYMKKKNDLMGCDMLKYSRFTN